MFLASINSFMVPYNIAFESDGIILKLTNAIIDACFITDIIISFRSAHFDDATGKEITNTRVIAKQYLKGRFWIDLLSSIPFEYIELLYSASSNGSLVFSLISLLKLFRILRLSRVISYLNVRNEFKISLRLIKLIFFLILYIHCTGCIWFYIINQKKVWVPPFDYMFVGTDYYENDNFFKYW
jgi:hyperpolarization activated cyclic nucleotide-gated potassium channel 2